MRQPRSTAKRCDRCGYKRQDTEKVISSKIRDKYSYNQLCSPCLQSAIIMSTQPP